MPALTAQDVIDTAMSSQANTLGLPLAGNIFRELTNSTYNIRVNLTSAQRKCMERYLEVPVVFAGGKNVSNDHPVLVALRDLIRDMFEESYRLHSTSLITLMIGCSMREVNTYGNNPCISFHIHGSESKDCNRIAIPALQRYQAEIKRKISKKTKAAMNKGKDVKANKLLTTYGKIQELVRDAINTGKTDKVEEYVRIVDIEPAQVLVYQDSFYNLSEKDYLEHFELSGAMTAYGYGLLPLELIYKEMPENEMYKLHDHGDGTASITFKYGYCNGYMHDAEAWSTLLRNPVIRGSTFDLVVEITARVGPFAIFSLTKSTARDTIIRTVSVPEAFRYCRVLDIPASFDRWQKTFRPRYFSVNQGEMVEVVNYLFSIAPASRTVETAMTFIRRRAGGVSLVTQQLLSAWSMKVTDYRRCALAAVMYVARECDEEIQAVEAADSRTVWDVLGDFFSTKDKGGESGDSSWYVNDLTITLPFKKVYEFLYRNRKLEYIITFMDPELVQTSSTQSLPGAEIKYSVMSPERTGMSEKPIVPCHICKKLEGKLGKQKLRCAHKESIVIMDMDEAKLDKVNANLLDTLDDPQQLADLKKRANKARPQLAFKKEVAMYYIRGGPGTGKSTIIRMLADKDEDFIYVPFARLIPDYTGLEAEDGTKYDLLVKTTHKGIEDVRCRKRMFVDEFSSMPYEYMMMMAQLAGVEEVYIVGDHRQTKVREPIEGLYIGNYVDLSSLSTHELMVNFRNGKDAVAWLNDHFGYEMESASKETKTFQVVAPGDVPVGSPVLKMTFSKATGALVDGSSTVRSLQGQTADVTSVSFGASDGALVDLDEMLIVMGSRHKKMCYLEDDGSPAAKKTIEALNLPEYQENYEKYLFHYDAEELLAREGAKEDVALVELLTERTPDVGYQKSTHKDEFARDLEDFLANVDRAAQKAKEPDELAAYENASTLFEYDSDADEDSRAVDPLGSGTTDLQVLEEIIEKAWCGDKANKLTGLYRAAKVGKEKGFLGAEMKMLSMLKKRPDLAKYASISLCESPGGFVKALDSMSVEQRAAISLPSGEQNYDADNVYWQKADFMVEPRDKWVKQFKSNVLITYDGGSDKRSTGLAMLKAACLWIRDFVTSRPPNTHVLAVVKLQWTGADWLALIADLGLKAEVLEAFKNPLSREIYLLLDSREKYKDITADVALTQRAVVMSIREVLNGNSNSVMKTFLARRAAVAGTLTPVSKVEYVSKENPWVTKGSPEFVDTAETFTTAVKTDTVKKEEVGEPVLPKARPLQAGMNSHELLTTLVPTAAQLNDGPLNSLASAQIKGDFSSGTLQVDAFTPINPRGNPKKTTTSYYAFSAGSGVHFGPRPTEELQSLQARYLKKNPKIFGTQDKVLLAKEMVDEFWSEHMDETAGADELDLNMLMQEFYSAADSKKYPEQFKGLDNPDVHTVRYHLKQIFKPAKGGQTPKMEKPGQGISAWNKDAQVLFGAVMRVMNYQLQARAKPHVVYDNRLTEEEAREKLRDAMSRLPAGATNAIVDAIMFDANQDEMTQLVEQEHLRKLGMHEIAIKLYYSFREKYKLLSDSAAGVVEYKKTSGEPGTLLNNTTVAATFMNFYFRGSGPMAMAMKGDDGFKRQVGIQIDHNRVARVNRHTVLRMVCSITEQAEFCGNAIVGDKIFTSVPRKLAKLAGHKFRDYQHFTEYQKSLRDWIDKTARQQIELISANAALYNMSFDECRAIYDTINSVSHIDENQFQSLFTKRTEEMVIPRGDHVDICL